MNQMDVFAQADAIKRRKALLAQQQQQLSQSQIVGNTGLGQALAQVAQAYVLKQGDKKTGAEETANRSQYNEQMRNEIAQYLSSREGTPGQVMSTEQAGQLMNNDVAPPPLAEPRKANPREAIVNAMSSNFPEMQAIGKADMAGMSKQQGLTQKDLLGLSGYDPRSKVAAAMGGDPSLLQPEKGVHVVNGQITTGNPDAGFQQAGDFRDKFGPVGPVGASNGKPIPGQLNTSTGEAKFAPQGTNVSVTPTIVNAAQKQGLGEWSTLAAKDVQGLAEKARGSVAMLGQLDKLEQLTKSGTYKGPLANPGVWLGQLSSAAGMPLSAKSQAELTNSQTFGNVAADLWLSTMNSAGGARGLVKEESERIANNLPALVQTPEGRLSIIAHMRQVAAQNVNDAQKAQKSYAEALQTQDPARYTFGLAETQIPRADGLPPTAAPQANAPSDKPISLDEYLRKMGGK